MNEHDFILSHLQTNVSAIVIVLHNKKNLYLSSDLLVQWNLLFIRLLGCYVCLLHYKWPIKNDEDLLHLNWDVVSVPPLPAAGGEARPADQEAGKAGPGWRQPGPAGREGVAEASAHDGDHRM